VAVLRCSVIVQVRCAVVFDRLEHSVSAAERMIADPSCSPQSAA